MEPTLRRATDADLPRIVEIYNSTIPSRLVTADLEPATVEDRTDWLNQRDKERHPVMVFDDSGEVRGWWSLQPFNERAAYDCTAEISVYLDEQVRGRGWVRAQSSQQLLMRARQALTESPAKYLHTTTPARSC